MPSGYKTITPAPFANVVWALIRSCLQVMRASLACFTLTIRVLCGGRRDDRSVPQWTGSKRRSGAGETFFPPHPESLLCDTLILALFRRPRPPGRPSPWAFHREHAA